MRLTIKTNNAIRLLMYCALDPADLSKSRDIAQAVNASENHLSKVANALAQAGILQTVRGRNGGLRLARPPAEITLGQVARVTDEGGCLVECFDVANNTCPLSEVCQFGGVLGEALQAFFKVLDSHTLADLLENDHQLARAMGLEIAAVA